MTHVPVLIAGAGPVGLSLAADLAWRGIESLIVEPLAAVHPHPRAISIGVRTMEHFRRLGLDQKTIDAGVPRGRPLDVVYVTRLLDREIFRFPISSIAPSGNVTITRAEGADARRSRTSRLRRPRSQTSSRASSRAPAP